MARARGRAVSQLPPRLWQPGYLLLEQQDGRLTGNVSRITALDPILPGNVMDVTTRDQVTGEERSRSFRWDDRHEVLEGYELAIEGAGTIRVELAQIEDDEEARPRYRHIITNTAGEVLEEAIGVGGPANGKVDHKRAMSDLLGFLGAAGEAYDAEQRQSGYESENHDLFNEAVHRWASEHDDALTMAYLELSPEGGLER
jgi:hypothetical protein